MLRRFLDRGTEEHILFHTELKVAVRTCEGKATHGMTQNWLRMFCGCLRRLRETIPLRMALVKIRAHSWHKKNTSRYVQIRGDFSVHSVDSV